MFCGKAYGFNIRSDFPLPELSQGGEKEDIAIRKSKLIPPPLTPTSIQRQGIEALFGGDATSAYLRWPGVATLLAEQGCTLSVDPDTADIDPQVLNLYILSEALGMLLYQRGLFLLHASAVSVGKRVIVFVAPPGMGKSTLAAAFTQAGHAVIADDMVALELRLSQDVFVLPAFPQVKIWPATIVGLGYHAAAFPPLYSGSTKRVMRTGEHFSQAALPLSCIYQLADSPTLRISSLTGTASLHTLLRFFPCPSGLLQGSALRQFFQQCGQLFRRIPIRTLERPRDFSRLKEVVHRLEQVEPLA